MNRTHTVICTAGHIDHGKSSLIIGLTGYNPDQLREEQEREMTIELGFAFYGDDVTFIDVPGHEKFLKTMLAGASSVDGSVLVIAADDGIMPQTREHFEILQLMGVETGIIALTKIDLVDEEWVELVIDDIRELTQGTFLEGAPVLPLSNRSGVGMVEFKAALDKLIASVPSRKDRGLFRMWIDRAFTIKGFGTVVAGTVLSGKAKLGQRVEILPDSLESRIKRIQVHKQNVESCHLGERAALNLPGIDKDEVKRGQLLATPDHYRPSFMLNARLNLMKSAKKPLEHRTRLRFHIGSSEQIGRVVLLDKDVIMPGESGFVQFRLESKAMADVGDKYVFRSFSEGRVLGGGILLEIHPPKARKISEMEIERLHRLESVQPRELVIQYLAKVGEVTSNVKKIAQETASQKEEIVDIIGALERDGEVVILAPDPKWTVVITVKYDELRQDILSFLEKFHIEKPYLSGVRRSELKATIMPNVAQKLLERLIRDLIEDGLVAIDGEIIRNFNHKVSFTPEQERVKDLICDLYRERRFVTPIPFELSDQLDVPADMVDPIIIGLCELGELVELFGPDGRSLFFHRDTIELAQHKLLKFFENHDEMKFFEFRELIGSTRKYTTPILMHFDNIGLTYRDGDVRKLQNKSN